jgi:hypothetical protein
MPLQYEVEADRLEIESGALIFSVWQRNEQFVDLAHYSVIKAIAPGYWTHVDMCKSAPSGADSGRSTTGVGNGRAAARSV